VYHYQDEPTFVDFPVPALPPKNNQHPGFQRDFKKFKTTECKKNVFAVNTFDELIF
jgi:hypothetical protein